MENKSAQSNDYERMVFIGGLTFEDGADFQKIQETIKKAFKNPGANAEVKVYPNRSKQGIFYAFVTFSSAEDAHKVLEAETITINRNTVRVEKFIPRNDNQIYIRDIGNLTREVLEGMLNKFGKITNIHVFEPSTGNTIKACNVMFERQEDAENCLRQHEINANGVVLRLQRSTQGKHEGKEQPRLFLRKIPWNNNKAELESLLTKELEKFGKLTKSVEIEYKDKETMFGTAVIAYEDPANMEKAKKGFNRGMLGNDLLDLTDYQTKKDRDNKGGVIYVSHILPNIPTAEVLERIGQYGKIENNTIYQGETRLFEKCKKGTITFENKDSVKAILSDIDNPLLEELFLNRKTKINIFLDKADRVQYMKAINKPSRPVNPAYQGGFMMHPNMMQMMMPMPNMGGMPVMGGMGGMSGMGGMGNMGGMSGMPMGPMGMPMGNMPMGNMAMGNMAMGNMPPGMGSVPPGMMPMMIPQPNFPRRPPADSYKK